MTYFGAIYSLVGSHCTPSFAHNVVIKEGKYKPREGVVTLILIYCSNTLPTSVTPSFVKLAGPLGKGGIVP